MAMNSKRRHRVKERLLQEQDGLCYLCGCLMDLYDRDFPHNPRGASLDHVYPRIMGGSDAVSNMAMACYSCNQSKDSLLPIDITTMEGRDRALGLHTFLVNMLMCQPLRCFPY